MILGRPHSRHSNYAVNDERQIHAPVRQSPSHYSYRDDERDAIRETPSTLRRTPSPIKPTPKKGQPPAMPRESQYTRNPSPQKYRELYERPPSPRQRIYEEPNGVHQNGNGYSHPQQNGHHNGVNDVNGANGVNHQNNSHYQQVREMVISICFAQQHIPHGRA